MNILEKINIAIYGDNSVPLCYDAECYLPFIQCYNKLFPMRPSIAIEKVKKGKITLSGDTETLEHNDIPIHQKWHLDAAHLADKENMPPFAIYRKRAHFICLLKISFS